MYSPQEVVSRLERRGHLERRHIAALRIDPRKDVPDRAVLARRIHPLQHNQHSLLLPRVEDLLQLGQALAMLHQHRCYGLFGLEPTALVRLPV